MPTGARPSYDAYGNEIPAPRPRARPRQMRPAEDRAQDANPGVRRQAVEELQRRRPSYDAQGNEIQPSIPMATAPSRSIPERQAVVETPPEVDGNPLTRAAVAVSRWVTGDGQRQEGVGEIAYQSIPERDNVQWEGGPLSGVLNALPQGVRGWLDAQGRANAVGLGFFLDPNEEHRAQIIQRQVPTAQFRRDEFGNLQVRYDETTPWAYINRPGASTEDAQTFASELGKYLVARRVMPGGNFGAQAGATSPLLTSTAREASAAALSMAGGQGAATVVGGPGIDPIDVGVAAAGGAAGNVLGHVVASTPGAVGRVVSEIADRFPGGAQRAAERQAANALAQESRIAAARTQAAEAARLEGERIGLVGDRLQRAIAQAETEAEERIVAETMQTGPGESARRLDELARSLGINLTRSQGEFDAAGVRFLYDAAQGHYGRSAEQAAVDFIERQATQLPAALRNIAGNRAVTSPQAGVAEARAGMQSLEEAGTAAERSAWERFNTHADRYIRTYDQTPAGNPSGVARVTTSLDDALAEEKVFLNLPEYAAQYPQVSAVMSLARRMNAATREDLPIHDVDRVIQLKRFIDSAWESAATNAERRILTRMGTVARDWLRDAAAYNEGVPAALRVRAVQTAELLRGALQLSQQNAQRFRENPIIRDMLERVRPNAVGQPEGALAMTDQEVARRLFGGGEQGLSVSGDSLQALRALKDTLGPSSPEWQSLRQAALQRLTAGLDSALLTRQSAPVITAIKSIQNAFNANGEALRVLFSPEELARMRDWQQVARAIAPPARNPVNSSGSADSILRIGRGIVASLFEGARMVPLGVGEIARAAESSVASARVAAEVAGAAKPSQNISRALAEYWNVNRNVAGAAGGAGAAFQNTDATGRRESRGY